MLELRHIPQYSLLPGRVSLLEILTTTDRNLLFAVLAFQDEFIDLLQLADACRAWAADKLRPMAELLGDCGRMRPRELRGTSTRL